MLIYLLGMQMGSADILKLVGAGTDLSVDLRGSFSPAIRSARGPEKMFRRGNKLGSRGGAVALPTPRRYRKAAIGGVVIGPGDAV